MSDYNEIRNALNHLDANDRDFWVKIGAAVKDELGEDGFELWDEWSRHSENYKSNDAKAVWKSLKQGHIHIGTLFYHARKNGYRPNKPYTPPSAEELAKRAAETQEKQRAEAERITQAHAKAEKTAYGIWKNASPADPNHAYAQTKGLGLNTDVLSGIRQSEYQGKKQLVIPLYSDNKLVNVQTIDEDGHKKFLNGGQKQGAYTVIGDLKQSPNGIFLAEGFATASSVYQATKKPVVVAFDAGNLKAVSEKLINVLPENVPVYFAADNDPSHTGEHKAQAAAAIWGERAKIILPEFTPKQIHEFKEDYGTEKIPTDFNDLHKLAGIEAVRETFGIEPEPYIIETETDIEFNRQPESNPQEILTAWNDFPPVISNGKLGDLKNEPEYAAAKAGDVMQSALLVDKLLKDETIQEIKNLIGDSKPIIVPIQSEEASGKNRIPQAMAFALSEKLGLQVDTDIVQSNTAKRTNAKIDHRFVSPPEFTGTVKAGQPYLIVDDTLTVGGTIAALKGYIENNGGKVIGSTVMTAHEQKADIVIKPNVLQSLQQKQGLNEYWRNEFGYSVDKLTQQEAGHLRKPTLEQIQERIEEAKIAKQASNISENKELHHERTTETQFAETRNSEVSNVFDRAGSERIESIRQGDRKISQSVFQQEQATEQIVNQPAQSATSEKDVADFSFKEMKMDNLQEHGKPDVPREELLKNNYWRVQNGYSPLPENDQKPEQTTTPEKTTYSADNPYAQWAEHDDEVRHNADSWEMRTPLTNERLAHFNQQAEQYGFTTYIENRHAELGVFQADKWTNETYHVEIDGKFKNHGSMAAYEDARDFTMSFHENDEIVHYVYTNHLDDALQQANDFLQNPAEWIKEQDLKMQAEAMQPENAPAHQSDAATLSAADKLKTQSEMPDERQINSSPIADTEAAPKVDSLGNKTIPPEVLRSSQEMTTSALSPEVANAKSAYDQKAKQLSEPNQARLKAYERNTMDALRDVQGDARNHAFRNFYEHTTKVMNGTELNLPQPLQHQAPAQQQTHEPKPSNSQEFEMER